MMSLTPHHSYKRQLQERLAKLQDMVEANLVWAAQYQNKVMIVVHIREH